MPLTKLFIINNRLFKSSIKHNLMELINTRAIKLKKHSIKQSRRYGRKSNQSHNSNQYLEKRALTKFQIDLEYKNKDKSTYKNNLSSNQILKVQNNLLHHNTCSFISMRQNKIILKVLKNKVRKSKTMRINNIKSQQKLFLKRNTFNDFKSMQLQTKKPTDKYFHRLDNIRIAQNLLFIKPSKDLSRTWLEKSYQQQQNYRINISKLAQKTRKININENKGYSKERKKWID